MRTWRGSEQSIMTGLAVVLPYSGKPGNREYSRRSREKLPNKTLIYIHGLHTEIQPNAA